MNDMSQIMKQAKAMQEKMAEMQKKLEDAEIEGISGGGAGPSNSDVIDSVTIASTGDAADFGDLSAARQQGHGASDSHGGLQG